MKKILLGCLIAAMCVSCINAREVIINSNDDNHTVTVSGRTTTRTVRLSGNIDELTAAAVDVVYTPGTTLSATLHAPADAMEYIITEQDGDELEVRLRNGVNLRYRNAERARLELTAPSLKDIEALLGASVTSTAAMQTAKLDLDVTTGASITLAGVTVSGKLDAEASTAGSINITGVNAGSFDAEASTGASVKVAGTAARVDLDASTGASINAKDLTFTSGSADASTGGSIKCKTANLTTREASTGGSISD